ncbi:MAG: hypothetical protein IPN17_31960 [Deltaproteobacteria bacterium]|nr:hypothetical protein [Deltaproteobacteria bacterium]
MDVPVTIDAPAPPSPDAELVRGLASGSVELSAHIDPAHGVVFVTYPGGVAQRALGVRRSTRRLCGAAAARDAALRARLREAVQQATDNESMECSGDECVVSGMEYQPAYRLRLGRAPDGTRVLLGAMQLSEAALSDEWMERVRAYVAQGPRGGALARALGRTIAAGATDRHPTRLTVASGRDRDASPCASPGAERRGRPTTPSQCASPGAERRGRPTRHQMTSHESDRLSEVALSWRRGSPVASRR